jgi:DNA-binding Xre family transcriptional regulator
MTQNNRRRGFLASAEGIKKLEAKIYQKDFTNERLAEAAGLTTDDQIKKLRNPQWKKGIQKDAIEKIAKVLDLDPAEIVGDE